MIDWRAEIVAAAGLAAGFAALLAAVEAWARLLRPPPEWPRKAVHLLGGAVCLTFPLLLESPWTVGILGAGLWALIVTGRRFGFLRSLHGVERKSRGAEYYPPMIVVLFLLAHDRPWLYVASLLTLAVADALAALVGGRIGRVRYQIDHEHKTLEGSLTFFAAAVAVIGGPLALSSDPALPPVGHRLAVAVLVATLVTLFEAVARHGRDNIWVPLGTCLVLSMLVRQPLDAVLAELVSLAVVSLALTLALLLTRLVNVGATLALMLTTYGVWALTSFDWALPLFAGTALCFVVGHWFRPPSRLRVGGIVSMVLPVVLVAAAADLAEDSDADSVSGTCYALFLGAAAVTITQNLWDSVIRRRRGGLPVRIGWTLAVSSLVTAVVAGPLWLRGVLEAPWFLLLLAVCTLVCATHDRLFAGHPPSTQRSPFVFRRYAAIGVGMVVCAAAQAAGVAPPPRLAYQSAGSTTSTVPDRPSIRTVFPEATCRSRPRMPTTVGMPISRATTAEWESTLPRSIRMPETAG